MGKTERTEPIHMGTRFADFSVSGVLAVTLAVFLVLTAVGLVSTCTVDIGYSPTNDEHVSFRGDNILLNLVFLLFFFGVARALLALPAGKRTLPALRVILLLAVTGLGFWWVLSTNTQPYADAKTILDEAARLAAGNHESLAATSYFRIFPYQLGYLLYAELFTRVFGAGAVTAIALANVLWLDAAYLAVLAIAGELFRDERTELLTGVLLLCCLQPVFLCTFPYGVLPGLALSLMAVYCVTKYIRGGSAWLLPPAALCMGIAVLLRKNCTILLIACCIALAIHALRSKRFLTLAGIAAMALLAALLPAAVQRGYEQRADAAFGPGTPQGAWLVTGFQESSMCCGWFGSYTTTVLADNDFDQAETRAQIRADFAARMQLFLGRPRYLASFLYKKIVSQWNEPAFQSIWSSAVSPHAGGVSPLAGSVLAGEAGEALHAYFNYYVQFVYLGFTLGLAFLMRRRNRATDALVILPLTIFGAFLYHALFEAKSQYALVYLPMMLPFAGYGVKQCFDRYRLRKG